MSSPGSSPRPPARRAARGLAGLLLSSAGALTGACATARGPYVWADDYAARQAAAAAATAPAAAGYVVAPGDVLAVQVWDNAPLSAKVRVRADGRISLPLLDEVAVAGRTPVQVARDLEQRLRQANLVLAPRVSVALDEATPVSVSVLGKVARAGSYPLAPGSGVAEALASAGGLSEFAHRDRIYVVRREPEPVRVRFTFADATGARGATARAATFRLRAGDVVVVD